jgi:2-polyprenyl-3-methyl-5-hydroxy-6-metoxy-1,4-benzoquinol methylase
MNNADLQSHYDSGHKYTFDMVEEHFGILNYMDWDGLRVLEIGCGNGKLAEDISKKGGDVLAIDYSDYELKEFKRGNLEVRHCDYRDVVGKFDVVVMKGVLEHMDDPLHTLDYIKTYIKPMWIVTSSPSFLNPRGYIWMALKTLLDVPMSLTDLHYICPFDMQEWAHELGCFLEYESVDQDWGHGKRLCIDFEKRLKNALRDKGLKADVPAFIEWLEKTLPYRADTHSSGATVIYKLIF